LAAERAKSEKAIAEFAALFDRLMALADEKAKAAKAIAAFAALAERLDALAEERARPWWKRLVGWPIIAGAAHGRQAVDHRRLARTTRQ
jgi:hypothetical protein